MADLGVTLYKQAQQTTDTSFHRLIVVLKMYRVFFFFWHCVDKVSRLDTPGVKNFNEIALSPTVKEIHCTSFLSEIQNERHVWKEEIFIQNLAILLSYPMGQKIVQVISSHG